MKTPLQECWVKHIETWENSSLSQQAYCRENNLKACQFSYWKGKLSDNKASLTKNFVPISVSQTRSTNGFTIHFPNGYHISGIEAQHLAFLTRLAEVLR